MKYEWQDVARTHASIPCHEFRCVTLTGVEQAPIPDPPAWPLYLRLDPDRWALTIAWLAYAARDAAEGSRAIWRDVLVDIFWERVADGHFEVELP